MRTIGQVRNTHHWRYFAIFDLWLQQRLHGIILDCAGAWLVVSSHVSRKVSMVHFTFTAFGFKGKIAAT